MALTSSDVLILLGLFAVVPIQYILVQYFESTEGTRAFFTQRLLTSIHKVWEEILSPQSWIDWLMGIKKAEVYNEGECPAIEVLRYQNKYNYFTFSLEPRKVRPSTVQFRVGDVIRHSIRNYRGVVVGWDEVGKAPVDWYEQANEKNYHEYMEVPNYTILVDTRDRRSPQLTYVPQQHLQKLENTAVVHPMIDEHFQAFDGNRYVPRPWLSDLYPRD